MILIASSLNRQYVRQPSNPADGPFPLCNGAEPGSLALPLTGSPLRGFDAQIAPSPPLVGATCCTGKYTVTSTDHNISPACLAPRIHIDGRGSDLIFHP